ncbi:hypothetical protein GUJ93_ZPchr0011g28323 [Zizania palustris]|uniref:RING-type domain-containing protein n=1 Tax=Zizania palustris TaxID=103762 RepID=A0A8J6BUD7_ZIZPA|nr:hypothetical protein GUJ93_ZPchr0011g28323 [Zizania palustris]
MSTTTSRPDEAAIESIVDAVVDAIHDAFCPSNADSVSPSAIADDAASKASSATRMALSSLLTRLPPATHTTTAGLTEAPSSSAPDTGIASPTPALAPMMVALAELIASMHITLDGSASLLGGTNGQLHLPTKLWYVPKTKWLNTLEVLQTIEFMRDDVEYLTMRLPARFLRRREPRRVVVRGVLPAAPIGASRDAVLALPETKAADVRQEECAMCLEDFEADDKLKTMPCSHSFHDRCFSDWLQVSRTCPLCCHALPKQQSADYDLKTLEIIYQFIPN